MRWTRGLAVLALVVGGAGAASPAAAEEEPFPLDVAPIWAVVEGSQFCCGVTAEDQIIGGQSWEDGDEIDLYINAEYVATTIAEPNDEGSATPVFDINALGIVINAGDQVRLERTDGGRTETHVVTGLNVSLVSVPADIVAGVADPGSEVWVFVPNTLAYRIETVDAQSRWTADFSVPGDQLGEEAIFDLDVLTPLGAAQFDADGNATLWLTVAAAYSPVIAVVDGAELLGAPSPQFTGGQSWEVDDVVDLYINGSFVATTIAEPNAEGSASPFYDVNAMGITILPDDEIRLFRRSDGRTETHVVTELAGAFVDAASDTVTGWAAPSSTVFVFAESSVRIVIASETGEWIADFSQPGDDLIWGDTADLLPTMIVQVGQFDADGNTTMLWATGMPTSKDQCKDSGWEDFGAFENQGQCVRSVVAASGGFEDTELELNTGAWADFGFGETAYRAVGTVPARLKQDVESVMVTYFVEGLRYTKVDPEALGPAYFDLTDGTYRASGRGDLDDPSKGFGKFQWHVELITDQGVEYRSTGIILDRNSTEDRDVWVWSGPIMEP